MKKLLLGLLTAIYFGAIAILLYSLTKTPSSHFTPKEIWVGFLMPLAIDIACAIILYRKAESHRAEWTLCGLIWGPVVIGVYWLRNSFPIIRIFQKKYADEVKQQESEDYNNGLK